MIKAASSLRQIGLTLLTALLIVSCNSGGGFLASGGIGGTGVTAVSVGPITQFGSIFVNGIEYKLKDAKILVNGKDVTAGTTGNGDQIAKQTLAIGQVVKVTGTVDSTGISGTATQVTFNANVNGPINGVTPVDANTKELTVLGQPVVVDQDTKFVGTLPSGAQFTLGDVTDNMVVEVSGLTNANGKLHATYLKFEEDSPSASTTVDVQGTISELDTPNSTFTLNGNLTVHYLNADTSSLPNGTPADNLLVEVKGTVDTTSNVVQATQITLESEGLGGGDAQSADIEGFITNFTSAASAFTVDSQQVQATAATVYSGGLVTDLGTGVKVEVQGTLRNGVLTAAKITFKDDVELEANVSNVSAVNHTGTLTLSGLPGITVAVNGLTQLSDNLNNSLSTLQSGWNVKVRGRADGSGTTVTATELDLEKMSPSNDVSLQGPVESINGSIVTILGIGVDAHGVTSFSSGDASLSETQFLSGLQAGDVVKASGTLSGSTLTWQEMELEK